MAAVIAHNARHLYVDRLPDVDPFVHVFTELVVFSSAGAVMLATVAVMRNRIRKKRSRGADADR
ncbi:hypothetical protein [Microvirga subterranea]|uniref:hypothetical protein n=1 Tax=Microvirga subterranea TaxID=186651 RepID=UPI000E0A68F2|nr:hypothetical protein [Microvirga subterranea]